MVQLLVTARLPGGCLSSRSAGIKTALTADHCTATNMVLYQNLRIHHVFGANTDVGKTVFSAVLTLASVAANRHTFYLKPVSTGSLTDADDRFVGVPALLPAEFPIGLLQARRALFARQPPVTPVSKMSIPIPRPDKSPSGREKRVPGACPTFDGIQPHPTIKAT